jgi:V/A-type H+/Na+-transporting ATPase subunit I
MIIPVKKILIYGMKEEVDLFFKKAQAIGCLEFINEAGKKSSELPVEIRELLSAIKILRHMPKSSAPTEESFASLQEAARRVVFLHTQMTLLQEEERFLRSEIARVSPFGHFSQEEFLSVQKEARRFLQFFEIPTSRRAGREIPRELIYIGTEYDIDYFVSISKERKKFQGMAEVVIEKPLGVLEEERQQVLWKISHFSQELESLASYFKHFQRVVIEKLNDYHLQSAKGAVSSVLEERLFMVEGWLPDCKKQSFLSLIGEFAVNWEEIAISKEERIPTYLKNRGAGKLGEDLVAIYDIPAIEDRDPSPWVFCFFVLFFAMIIADAGYGLLYLGLALFLKFKGVAKEGFMKRFNQTLFVLSFACIGWGILSSSFLGIEIPPTSSISSYLLLDRLAVKKASYHMKVKDDVYQHWVQLYPRVENSSGGREFLMQVVTKDKEGALHYPAFETFKKNILLEFSLLLGAIHISLSLLRYLRRNWPALGWVLFILGGYLYFPSILHATSLLNFLDLVPKATAYMIGPILIYSGVSLAMLLALLEKKLSGWDEFTKSVSVLSDILSYLRLYAFGLSSSMLAATFNMLGADLPLYVGWMVIVSGHLINFLLGIMGGVIHGLRLNFIESYHYSFIGDGRLFQPLKLLK